MKTTPTPTTTVTAVAAAPRRLLRRILVAFFVAGALIGAVGASPARAEDNVTNEYKLKFYTVSEIRDRCESEGGNLESPVLGTWRGWHSCEDSFGNEIFFCVRDDGISLWPFGNLWLCFNALPAPETDGGNAGTAPPQPGQLAEPTESSPAATAPQQGELAEPTESSPAATAPQQGELAEPTESSPAATAPQQGELAEPTESSPAGPRHTSGIVIMPNITSGFVMRG